MDDAQPVLARLKAAAMLAELNYAKSTHPMTLGLMLGLAADKAINHYAKVFYQSLP